MPTFLTPDETRLAAAIGFEPAALRLVKAAGDAVFPLEPLAGHPYREGVGEAPAAGAFSVAVPREQSEPLLAVLRAALVPRGYLPFLAEMTFDFEQKPDRIAVLRTDDPLAPLRFCGTSAGNFDLSPDDILARFRDWQRRFSFAILGAERDTVLVEFHTLPDDPDAFVRELYQFCPDLLDQGIACLIEDGLEYLPPDQRIEIRRRLDADTGGEEGRVERVALAILAEDLRERRRISLWWD